MTTFADWLRAHHYGETTIKKTFTDLKRAQGLKGPTQEPNMVSAMRRYVTYAEETGLSDRTYTLAKRLGVATVVRLPHERARQRTWEARSFDPQDWIALRNAVANSLDPRDQVLWAMITTGLRIGDILSIPAETIARALKSKNPTVAIRVKGGALRELPLGILEPWLALGRGMRKAGIVGANNVAAYVADGDNNPVAGGAAYFRMHRRIKAHEKKLGLSGRTYTHKIRRTVAVNALNETDNIVAVQQMLGHASMNSTAKYVDEANHQRTARLQRRIAGLAE